MFVLTLALLIAPIDSLGQAADGAQNDTATIVIRNAAGKEAKFGVDDLSKLTVKKLTVKDPHSGVTSEFEGVLLPELLKAGGVTFGKDLRGPLLASYVLAEARDGYRIVFSIGEVDPGTGGTEILVAFKKNDKPMVDPEGPFRIVVPQDKRPARWIRQLTGISLIQLPPQAGGKSSK